MLDPQRLAPHILATTDFGPQSRRAFFHALAIAVAQQAHMTLLHIGPESREEVPWKRYPGVRETLAQWKLLDEGAERTDVARLLGLSVKKFAMRDEDPYNGTLDYLRKHPTDLLVMATEARRGLARLRQASVAQAIAYATNSRALLLPTKAGNLVDSGSGLRKLRKALFVYDHEPDPRPALPWLSDWLPKFSEGEIEVHLLYLGERNEAPDVVLPEQAGLSWKRVARQGTPLKTIIGYANECDADLIVMLNQRTWGLLGRIRGSLSEQVLRRAGKPMLLLPEH